MALNRWQTFWRSMDEARMVVRLMVFAKFAVLVGYVFIVTNYFFEVIHTAMSEDRSVAEITGVLTAATAFAGVTIPVLVNIYRDVWKDYRQSGTDWKSIE